MNVDCSLISCYLAKKIDKIRFSFESKVLNRNSLLYYLNIYQYTAMLHRSIGRYRRLRDRKLLTSLKFSVISRMLISSLRKAYCLCRSSGKLELVSVTVRASRQSVVARSNVWL